MAERPWKFESSRPHQSLEFIKEIQGVSGKVKIQTTLQTTLNHASPRAEKCCHVQLVWRLPTILIASARLGIVVTGASRCSLHGNIVMRILSKRQLKELVLYSPQHIARLEKAGQFPKRVHLGPSRVGWVEAEVLDWLQKRLDRREAPSRHSF